MNKALLDAFRVFGECFPGAFFCLSDDGMAFGERNDRFLRLAGCSGEELLRQFPDGFGSFVDIRDRDAVLQEIERQIRNGRRSSALPFRERCPGGSPVGDTGWRAAGSVRRRTSLGIGKRSGSFGTL